MIDIAVPGDVRIEGKEDETTDKYGDLCRELKRPWDVRCAVEPIVVGALGTFSKTLSSFLALFDTNLSVETV